MTNSSQNLEIVRTLGVGGMATVYLARRDEGGTSRVVAVKKPHAFLAEDPATMPSSRTRPQLGACIRHPNVVGVIDFVRGRRAGARDGVGRRRRARRSSSAPRRRPAARCPSTSSCAIARDVLAGLHAAHESRRADGRALDVVHRDVSPQNVLVGFDGSARFTDFGVAKAACRASRHRAGRDQGQAPLPRARAAHGRQRPPRRPLRRRRGPLGAPHGRASPLRQRRRDARRDPLRADPGAERDGARARRASTRS